MFCFWDRQQERLLSTLQAFGFLDELQVCSYSQQQPAPWQWNPCQSPLMLSSHLIAHLFNELFHEWKTSDCEFQLARKISPRGCLWARRMAPSRQNCQWADWTNLTSANNMVKPSTNTASAFWTQNWHVRTRESFQIREGMREMPTDCLGSNSKLTEMWL